MAANGPPRAQAALDAGGATAGGAATRLGWVVMIVGLLGLLTHPLFIADPTARYLILLADVVALALAGWIVTQVVRGKARLDFTTVSGALYAGVSLVLFVSYVSGPPPSPGGT